MRPANPLHGKDFEVRETSIDVAQRLVRQYHYAKGGSKTGVLFHGLYRRGVRGCLGVAWWLPPAAGVPRVVYPANPNAVLSLHRVALEPGLPTNAASFLVGASIRLIRDHHARWECLITEADTWQEHTGKIYRATNWEYVGLTHPQEVYVDRGGVMVSRKNCRVTRNQKQMEALGYTLAGVFPKHRYRIVLGPREAKGGLPGVRQLPAKEAAR